MVTSAAKQENRLWRRRYRGPEAVGSLPSGPPSPPGHLALTGATRRPPSRLRGPWPVGAFDLASARKGLAGRCSASRLALRGRLRITRLAVGRVANFLQPCQSAGDLLRLAVGGVQKVGRHGQPFVALVPIVIARRSARVQSA